MMDGGAPYNPRTVEEVFRDFKGRQAGMIKALTTDVQEFYQQCDPEKKNLCLYGFPSEQWELILPAGEVPPDLPEPTLGINLARDAMHEMDWLSLVAVHSDVWLLSVAFYFGARFGFDKADRKHLFNMTNDLPTIFEVVTGAAKKQTKEKSSVSNHSNNKSKSNSKMVKTRNTIDDDTILATKATWDNELTMIFCELCVNEVNAGNRPTTHLNSNGWENVITLFRSRTQKSYEKSQLKNKWDTLKKEWRLWNELLRNSTGLEWCPYKKTIDATEEWWAEKIQENNDYKVFKMRGIEPRLNELMWQMFGDVVATGEHARAPSSSVLPGGAFGEDATPIEGSGDSDEHDIENEVAPDDDIDENASLETSNRGKQVHGIVQNKGKKSAPMKRSVGKTLTTEIENLCDGMSNQMKSVNGIVFSRSSYSVSDAMDALRAMENEIPRKSSLYFFATKIFQVPVKREVFLNLDLDLRAWWLQCEYDEQNDTARFSPLVATPSFGFQPFQQTPPPPSPPPPSSDPHGSLK